MAIGYLILKRRWRWNDIWFKVRKKTLEYRIQQDEVKQSKKQMLQEDIDRILEKIHKVGFDGLSEDEQKKLYEGSKALSRLHKKD